MIARRCRPSGGSTARLVTVLSIALAAGFGCGGGGGGGGAPGGSPRAVPGRLRDGDPAGVTEPATDRIAVEVAVDDPSTGAPLPALARPYAIAQVALPAHLRGSVRSAWTS